MKWELNKKKKLTGEYINRPSWLGHISLINYQVKVISNQKIYKKPKDSFLLKFKKAKNKIQI